MITAFRIAYIALLVFLVSSCGISKEKQDRMSESLEYELNESFIEGSLVLPSKISVELKDIGKSKNKIDDEKCVYEAHFSFKFNNFWDNSKYTVSGFAYFDDNGNISIQNGKKSIRIYTISKNHQPLSSDEIKSLRPTDTLGW